SDLHSFPTRRSSDLTGGVTNLGTDTNPSYEDLAFGGAGRDVLLANTGGDRLIDWVGEFDSYLTEFAPFGMATVSRTMQPQLPERSEEHTSELQSLAY